MNTVVQTYGARDAVWEDLLAQYEYSSNHTWVTRFKLKTLRIDLGQIISHHVDNETLSVMIRENESVIRLVFDESEQKVWIRLASNTSDELFRLLEKIKEYYPKVLVDENDVTVRFWNRGGVTSRTLVVPTWNEIRLNYGSTERAEVDKLTSLLYPESDGKFILWHGAPGTGKTYAIRALLHSWRGWVKPEYIIDSDAFFSGSADYMMSVITGSEYADKWRLLIFEDTGELLSHDARSLVGHGLSRFLNVADGLIGQGMKVLMMITTNEAIETMHPAVVRPGRCISLVKFDKLDNKDSSEWAQARGFETDGAHSLAELYALAEGRQTSFGKKPSASVGFRRPVEMADIDGQIIKTSTDKRLYPIDSGSPVVV